MQNKLRVFLIDDDPDDQEMFGIVMEETFANVECIFADSGISALEKIKRENTFVPGLIFIDINMPKMNGLQCLVEIKKVDRLRHTPAYMYSTSSDRSIVEQSKILGASGFVKKLSDLVELKSQFRKIIDSHYALVE